MPRCKCCHIVDLDIDQYLAGYREWITHLSTYCNQSLLCSASKTHLFNTEYLISLLLASDLCHVDFLHVSTVCDLQYQGSNTLIRLRRKSFLSKSRESSLLKSSSTAGTNRRQNSAWNSHGTVRIGGRPCLHQCTATTHERKLLCFDCEAALDWACDVYFVDVMSGQTTSDP